MILLGWKIPTGERVEIPETGHLAWFGQTQLSGKTTALEAIAFRGELKAVAFITKQGEGGFLTGRMIPPYFSEPTNDEEQPLWRWVKSILEASQQRRMSFEESWIIRCCEDPRQAKTLADVHANIKSLLAGEKTVRVTPGWSRQGRRAKGEIKERWIRKPVSGINAGVYTSLKAYFDIVMPQLARLPYTKKLSIGPGLNVMDLREYAMETQALVIRSVMEWVYQHERNVRVIVPEAQDFVPQGKNSPVKMACETLVRKAGANKNFMWLDSQDMAAVDKIMLRACSIVGIGVQTEMHEIDRSLAGLFTPQLRPIDIARLKIGEFFVRTPEARVAKVYVQPAWMDSELHAQAIAKGEESVSSARQMLHAFKDRQKSQKSAQRDLDQSIVPPISAEADDAMGVPSYWRKSHPAPHQLLQVQIQEPPDAEEDSDVSAAGQGQSENEMRVSTSVPPSHGDRGHGSGYGDGASSNVFDTQTQAYKKAPSHESEPPADDQERQSVPQSAAEDAAAPERAHRSDRAGNPDGHERAEADPSALQRPGSRAVVETQEKDSPHKPAVVRQNVAMAGRPAEALSEGGNPNPMEPGNHENQNTAESGDPGFRSDDRIPANASENAPLPESVPGAFIRAKRSADQWRDESEGAMPETPFEKVTRMMLVEKSVRIDDPSSMRLFESALRDLLKDHAALIEAHDALAAQVAELRRKDGRKGASPAPAGFTGDLNSAKDVAEYKRQHDLGHTGNGLSLTVPQLDYICTYVKAKFEKDPAVLELIAHRPELRVKIDRQTVDMDDSSIIGRIARLLHEGYFKTPRNGPAVQKELKRCGCDQPTTNLYKPLNRLTEMGFLTLEPDGYQEVAEMKVMVQKA